MFSPILTFTEMTTYFMARKRKVNDYGTGIPIHEVDALARVRRSRG